MIFFTTILDYRTHLCQKHFFCSVYNYKFLNHGVSFEVFCHTLEYKEIIIRFYRERNLYIIRNERAMGCKYSLSSKEEVAYRKLFNK